MATHPNYRTTETEAGVDVNYDCPCGCDAGFAYRRAEADQAPESCCCGRNILVGEHAHNRLRAWLPDAEQYEYDQQVVTTPWGQDVEVVLATPPDAEHSSEGHEHDDHEHHEHGR